MRKGVAVVSDTHCGSIFGLLPPDFETSAGVLQPQNKGQKYLWECWLDLCKWFGENEVVAIVHNGDLVDGQQQAQRGTELCLPIWKDQGDAAKICIEAAKKQIGAVPIFVVQGTEFHDAKGGQAADAVAEAIGAQPYQGVGTGKFSHEILDLEIDGVIINFMHHISVSAGLYRATAPDREALWSALAGKEGKAEKADCLVRSHAHYFNRVEHETKHAIITPCLQLPTRFSRRHSAYRMLPSLGGIIVWVDGDVKKAGGDPIGLSKRLYPLPRIKPTKLQIE